MRTHETRKRLPVFKTGPFNHSGTHPLNSRVSTPGVGRNPSAGLLLSYCVI